jgi:hypothetical protein
VLTPRCGVVQDDFPTLAIAAPAGRATELAWAPA